MTKFDRKIFHNRDIGYKLCLINHVQNIFDLCKIREKVIRVIPTEYIDKKQTRKIMDFVVECKSGNIYDIECESSSVTDTTLDKTWDYAKSLICRYDNDIYTFIIALAENNRFRKKQIGTTTHKPIILEMKKLNGDEHLNKIKKKLNDNIELTSHDCTIIELIPDMKNTKKTGIIVEELCNIINKGKISIDNRIKLQATMWLNIDCYVKNQDKRQELMEMIDVEKSQESEFFKWQEEYGKLKENEGIEEGIEKGKREIIKEFLKFMDPKEIAEKTNISLSEIKEITEQQP